MENYDWIPPGLDREEIEEFFQNFSKNKIPLIGSTGEINRKKVLFRQIPKHDMEYEFCEHLKTKKSVGDFFKYAFDRNLKALDIGLAMKNTLKRLICKKCKTPIPINSIYIQATDRSNIFSKHNNNAFHPNCFKCVTCDEFLADLAYCMKKEQLFCIRHYGDAFKSRCAICDEVSQYLY